MEGLQVRPGDGVQAAAGGQGRGEMPFAVEQEGGFHRADGIGVVVAALDVPPGALEGQVEPVLGEGGTQEHVHEKGQAFGQVLLQHLQGHFARGGPAVAPEGGSQIIQALVHVLRGPPLGAAAAQHLAEERGQALLALGLQVGAALEVHRDAHEGHAFRFRTEVHGHPVGEPRLVVPDPGHGEGEGGEGEPLGTGRDGLGGQDRGRQEGQEADGKDPHLTSGVGGFTRAGLRLTRRTVRFSGLR